MLKTKRVAVLAAVVVAVLVVAGVAWAAIPSTDGTIHGCYKIANPNKGTVIAIDVEAGANCPSGYAPLSWPSSKPKINAASQGTTSNGTVQHFEVSCPNTGPGTTWEATSAYVYVLSGVGQLPLTVDPGLHYSYRPVITEAGLFTGYEFAVQGTDGTNINVGINCLSIDSAVGP